MFLSQVNNFLMKKELIMTIRNIINNIEKLPGNLTRGNGRYISAQNMKRFAKLLNQATWEDSLLFTPFLIVNHGALYELHYYEFDIEIKNEPSHYEEYSPKNSLPQEIVEHLKPQAIVSAGDRDFYQKVITEYLNNMEKMTFDEIINYYPELKEAQVFYQIIVDSD